MAISGASSPIAIVPSWISKTLDFSVEDPDHTGLWKTLYRVEYLYRDWGVIPVTCSITVDGGATWQTQTKNVGGRNNGGTEHAHFYFVLTGQFFIIQFLWPSSTTDFQFLGFDAVYQENGETFPVNGLETF